MLKSWKIMGLTGLAYLAAIAFADAEDLNLPKLSVPVCSAAPKVDGILDDACWKSAAMATNFNIVGEAGQMTGKHKAYVTRDTEWLYVGFDVAHPAPERNPPTYRKHDDLVQRENNVQISVDPGTDGDLYYQFLVSPANVRADFRMTKEKGRERENWNIPWRSTTKEVEAGWTAEIALPLCLLLTHGDAAKAKINLIVVTFLPARDRQAVQLGVRREETSWAPLRLNFNEPERFGLLQGLDSLAVKAPFLPFMTGAKVGAYRVDGGKYFYDMTVGLQALSGRTGTMEVVVTDKPEGGPDQSMRQAVALPGYSTQDWAVAVPAKSLAKRVAEVALVDAGSREVWQRILVDETAALDLFGCYLDRNYYTTEETAQAVCRIGMPAEGLKGMLLRAKGADGKTLAENKELKPAGTIGIPLNQLTVGEHKVTIELCQADGSVATRQEVALVKRAPKPGCEWKIDRVNRVLLKNGAPFFPYGFIMAGIGTKSDWAFKDVGENGFTSIIQWASHPAEKDFATDARAYLDAAAACGLQAIAWPETYTKTETVTDPEGILTTNDLKTANDALKMHRGNLTNWKGALLQIPCLRRLSVAHKEKLFFQLYEKQLPYFLTAINNAKDASNLIGYYLFDEPLIMELNQDVAGRHYYQKIQATDGYHPAFLLYSSEIPESRRAIDWCDALGTDPYWIPASSARATVNWVSKIVANTGRRAGEVHAVTFTVPMAEYWSGCKKRSILPNEQRCQTYLALIHGSKAIWYFFYPLRSQAVFDELKVLAHEMRTLGPICLMPEVEQQVTYNPGLLDPINDKFTDIQVSLKRRPEGGFVLLAANTAWYPVDASFQLSLLGESGMVRRLFATNVYPITSAAFADRLEPFGTRAYAIESNKSKDKKPEPETAVAISVNMTPHADLAEREQPDTIESSRGGKKNRMPNSSFERDTVPGWPDYFHYSGEAIMPGERIGAAGQVWGTDTNQAFHGRASLRVIAHRAGRRLTYIELRNKSVWEEQPREYVLSAWMRADRAGVKVQLMKTAKAQFTLTTEWKRYHTKLTIQPKCDEYFLWAIDVLGSEPKAAVWIDALQLEQGDQPTDYEP